MAKINYKYIDGADGTAGQVLVSNGSTVAWSDQTGGGGGTGYDLFDRDGSSDIQPKATYAATYPFDVDDAGGLMPTDADTWTDTTDFDYDGNNDIQALAT